MPNQPCTAGAASAFEPDFVFPLENVTVAQGRDGLYSNKSNKIFTCVKSPPTLCRYATDGETWKAECSEIVDGTNNTSRNKTKTRTNMFAWQSRNFKCVRSAKNSNDSKFASNVRQRGCKCNVCNESEYVASKCIPLKGKQQNVLDSSTHFFPQFRVHFSIHVLIPAFAVSFVFFPVALFTATFTCVVNNLGGYRVSADTAPARVCIFYLS